MPTINLFLLFNKHIGRLLLAATMLLLVPILIHAQANRTVDLGNLLREQVAALQDTSKRIANQTLGVNEKLHRAKLTADFYAARNHKPAWINGYTIPEKVNQLSTCIRLSESNALLPEDYHINAINILTQTISSSRPDDIHPNTLASLDILLTDAYLLLGSHYLEGKIEPSEINDNWNINKKAVGMTHYLEKSLQKEDICQTLEELLPIHPQYAQLRQVLSDYKRLSWNKVEADWNILLQKGNKSPLVPILRQRLQITGDLAPGPTHDDFFDKDLEKAVMKFQRRHGMFYDGLVRSNVVNALNIMVEERIRQIKANMERWRWMPDEFGDTHIAINIPEFMLEMRSNGQRLYRDMIIIGRERFPTPSFSDTVEYLVLNPYWNIPKSIAKTELSVAVKNDGNHFETEDIEVF